MSIYESVPLPLGKTMCIRVIKIRPSTAHDFSDTILCEFNILNVETGTLLIKDVATGHRDLFSELEKTLDMPQGKTEYRALSYTWGDPPADHEIELHGLRFKVRKNLWDFLDRARRDYFGKYLWIDALCINQAMIQERNHQVSMMGNIYARAARVIVWLGACLPEDLAMMRKITATFYKQGPKGLDCLPRQHQKVILQFYNNAYWRRAWIVQEYVLAKSIDIWFGRLHIRPEILSQMLSSSYEDSFRTKIWESAAMKIVRCRETGVFALDDHQPPRHHKFLNLVKVFGQQMNCADRRDRVYALLPLLNHAERRELDIHPNYSRSEIELYISILKRLHSSAFDDKLEPKQLLQRLNSMLMPRSNGRGVQLAMLDLRSAWHGRGMKVPPLFSDRNHRCGDPIPSEPVLSLKIGGCPNCSLIPTIEGSLLLRHTKGFSLPQWIQWAKALMNSDKPDDILLGRRIAEDIRLIPALPFRPRKHTSKGTTRTGMPVSEPQTTGRIHGAVP